MHDQPTRMSFRRCQAHLNRHQAALLCSAACGNLSVEVLFGAVICCWYITHMYQAAATVFSGYALAASMVCVPE
ncbi:hypothetical protein COO60DRAFT_1538579, partial [Scenedesmus sp. NREL 46B-D3]